MNNIGLIVGIVLAIIGISFIVAAIIMGKRRSKKLKTEPIDPEVAEAREFEAQHRHEL